MKSVGVFDILGPIMIGPSSSHTAGAARLGKIAKLSFYYMDLLLKHIRDMARIELL